MITTVDGIIKKKGDSVFEIAYSLSLKQYIPMTTKVHISHQNDDNCYNDISLCQLECDKRNSRHL